MRIVGVVGTNGKTTICHVLSSLLRDGGFEVGVTGTIGTYYKNKKYCSELTTPSCINLYKLMREMVDDGVEILLMEVSAHAIYWDKVYGINFDVGVFTNLSRDHLDFFKDMQEYKRAKLKFFDENVCKYVVVNSDDQTGVEICSNKKDVIAYGIDNPADVFAIRIKERINSTSFVLNLFDCIYNINLPMVGIYNVSNALAAATAVSLIGVKTDDVCLGLGKLKGVSGRLECFYDGEFKVFIDYAHTPDGLEKVLNALKRICKNRLIVVFGCGGNRDRGKRAKMGEVAKQIADFVVVTSDNPRYEEPMSIISEIEKGVLKSGKEYVLIEDRVLGIEYALNYAKKDDLVVIAGKGGENYQDILGIKQPYNDKDTVVEILARGEK
jgi:UDP-N-acetylmuramoyl-L-alanyl-D-glutamate--2,6-diaminopimelate ligase